MLQEAGYVIGVDLGQAADYTAIAILRKSENVAFAQAGETYGDYGGHGFREAREKSRTVHLSVGYLERMPLGTPYTVVARHVRDLVKRPKMTLELPFPAKRSIAPILVVDATGVGRPVIDMMKADGLQPFALTITGGSTAEGGKVPKRDLVSSLQILFQSGRLKIAPALQHAKTLADELERFRVKIDPVTAHDSYGAWRSGSYDDLVLAVAVAAWYATRRIPSMRLNVDSWPTIQR